MADHALSLDRLSLRLNGRPLLRDVSLAARAGEITMVLGESGAGKSLSLLAIMGLAPQGAEISGRILLGGEDIAGMNEARAVQVRGRAMGMVFQEPMTALNPVQAVGQQIAETVRLHTRQTRTQAQTAARAALMRVGLEAAMEHRFPHELSGGQRQRVALAMATVLSPRLILADEPTTALDVVTQAHIMTLLQRYAHEEGAAILLVTHDLALAARFADSVVLMKDGAVVESGAKADVLFPPRNAVMRALIAASTRPVLHEAPSPQAPELLRLDRVRLDLPGLAAPILKDVSLTVKEGEILGLIGESGSGKSTLARALLGLGRFTGGDVIWRGAACRDLRGKGQIVFQDPASSFDPRWRIGRIVEEAMFSLPKRPTAEAARARSQALLADIGLDPAWAARFPNQLSGGQRQRLALARALAGEPEILILDEALSALDATTRSEILELLAAIARARSLSLLFISHDFALVRRLCDRVVVLKDGAVIEEGETSAVFASPRHAYTQALAHAALALEAGG